MDQRPDSSVTRLPTWRARSAALLALGVPGAVLAQSSAGAAPKPFPEVSFTATPTVFAPGTISTSAAEFGATFTPDGRTVYYTITDRQFTRMTILVSHAKGSGWSTPAVAPFSGVWKDGDPSLSPDGRTLYFISNRPREGDVARKDYDIWYVTRTPDGKWSEPHPVGAPIATDTSETSPSVAADGTLFFSRAGYIYWARRDGAGFAAPQRFPFHSGNGAVAPNGRFVVFAAALQPDLITDLFVTFADSTAPGGWSKPLRFPEPINSPRNDSDPMITPDGRWLYFASERPAPSPPAWPRPRAADYGAVRRELDTNIYNGLCNIYRVDLRGLEPPA